MLGSTLALPQGPLNLDHVEHQDTGALRRAHDVAISCSPFALSVTLEPDSLGLGPYFYFLFNAKDPNSLRRLTVAPLLGCCEKSMS